LTRRTNYGWPGPFAPPPLQGPHHYYGPVRQHAPRRYSHLTGSSRSATPYRPLRTVSGRAFPRSVREPQTRLMPPPCRAPPGQSSGTRQAHPAANNQDHGFDTSSNVTTRQQRFGFTHLPGPHLTPLRAPFPHRSPRRSSANAACGGLKPPPEGRLRRANLHLPHSIDSRRSSLPTCETPFIVRGTRYCVVGLVLVTALMRSWGRRLARLVARAMLVSPLIRW
jgi:hypothetical protein